MAAKSTVTIKIGFVDETVTPPVTELIMRRPKVKDQIAASKSGKDPETQECTLFATLCGVSFDTITNLDMADYVKIQKAYEDMTEGKN
jgi:D-arabinose 1-dehydrogenase-like Zn-dependent alcohol dehydrogenase